MKKPRLEDYGLTEELISLNAKQHALYSEKSKECLAHRKHVKKIILAVSFAISLFFFIISMANGFETDFSGIMLIICVFWDVAYGMYYFQTSDESSSDLGYDRLDRIESETIDSKVDEAIKKYNRAIDEYEEKAYSINKYSLVKAELLTPFDSSLGERWIVFSNIYLSNSRSFPDIDASNCFDVDFQYRYKQLTERQRNMVPQPKKCLNIFGKMEFYYPCSEMYAAMEGKKKGDIAQIWIGTKYRIIDVINHDVE